MLLPFIQKCYGTTVAVDVTMRAVSNIWKFSGNLWLSWESSILHTGVNDSNNTPKKRCRYSDIAPQLIEDKYATPLKKIKMTTSKNKRLSNFEKVSATVYGTSKLVLKIFKYNTSFLKDRSGNLFFQFKVIGHFMV